MPRLPSYRLHRPSGRAVVTINGKDHYLGPHDSKESKALYKKLIAEYLAGGRSTSYGVDSVRTTVAMLVSDYKEWARGYHPKSEYNQICYALRHISDYLHLPVASFGPRTLKALQAKLVETIGEHGRPLSRKYINATCDRIRRMFKWGCGNEIVDVTVYQALMTVDRLRLGRTKAPDHPPVEPVADSIVEATLPHCTKVIGDMIKLQRLTGMRPAEVCSLTPAMIDRTNPEVWVAKIVEHKNAWRGKTRQVCIGPNGQKLLLPYLLRSSNTECFSPAESMQQMRDRRNSERVTPDGHGNSVGTNRSCKPQRVPGTHYTTNNYRRAIWRACEKAFLPVDATDEQVEQWKKEFRWSPNQLRHSVATEIRKEFGLEAAQASLGHARVDATQIYALANLERAMDVARKRG